MPALLRRQQRIIKL